MDGTKPAVPPGNATNKIIYAFHPHNAGPLIATILGIYVTSPEAHKHGRDLRMGNVLAGTRHRQTAAHSKSHWFDLGT